METLRGKVLIIIPAYNEEASIGKLLDSLQQSSTAKNADIMVVNDFSTDSTEAIVRERGIKVISQIYNMGYGAALQLGYKYAFNNGYEYVIQLDADGQHDACNIDTLFEKISAGEYDIVIGSRYLEGSVSYKQSGIRLLSIRFFRWVIKHIGGVTVTDPTSGLQALNSNAFGYYAQYGNFDNKYPDLNMLVAMAMQGYKIGECPAVMHQREAGESMHSGVWKPFKYMVLMAISTVAVTFRFSHKRGRNTQ